MNREQYIEKAPRLRKGTTVAMVKLDDHGRRYSAVIETHASLSIAKRYNGRGAVALQKGESFPPLLKDLPVIAKPEEEAVPA